MIHLEIPSSVHEEQHLKMFEEFKQNWEEAIPWIMNLKEWENFYDFLQRIKDSRENKNLKPWYSPASLFFVVNEENRLVWWISIRHELTGVLSQHWWHIWYGIRPSERKKWYASEALKLALEEAKKLNINPVMLTCKKENIGSARTIMKNWWELECEYTREDKPNQKWWIKND